MRPGESPTLEVANSDPRTPRDSIRERGDSGDSISDTSEIRISDTSVGHQPERRRSSRRDVAEASHMLLYLNEATFVGEEGELLADEVRGALASGFPNPNPNPNPNPSPWSS